MGRIRAWIRRDVQVLVAQMTRPTWVQAMDGVLLPDKVLNILLVEDDQVDVMNVRRAFEKNHIANPLYVAANGLEGLEMLRSQVVPTERRIVLLDLNMPKMNGMEFLRELRGDPILQSIPVIVLTTSNDERDKVEAYNLNVAGYLLKPVTFVNFVDVMGTLNKYWTLVELP
jgi:CheY-like chemotaxis protein